MGWEIVLVVSVYKRGDWMTGLQGGALPRIEKQFKAPLPSGATLAATAAALASTVRDCEGWLNGRGVSLVTDIVVTVYALEVCDGGS